MPKISDLPAAGTLVGNELLYLLQEGTDRRIGVADLVANVSRLGNGDVELGSLTAPDTPHIDFHSSGYGTDYDSRIVVSGGAGTIGQGDLNIIAGRLLLNGSPVASGDDSFTFVQSTPSITWTIDHNLARYPSVLVIDSTGRVVEGDVQHLSTNSLVITFSGAFAGTASCN